LKNSEALSFLAGDRLGRSGRISYLVEKRRRKKELVKRDKTTKLPWSYLPSSLKSVEFLVAEAL
jgi:hypothetical protein